MAEFPWGAKLQLVKFDSLGSVRIKNVQTRSGHWIDSQYFQLTDPSVGNKQPQSAAEPAAAELVVAEPPAAAAEPMDRPFTKADEGAFCWGRESWYARTDDLFSPKMAEFPWGAKLQLVKFDSLDSVRIKNVQTGSWEWIDSQYFQLSDPAPTDVKKAEAKATEAAAAAEAAEATRVAEEAEAADAVRLVKEAEAAAAAAEEAEVARVAAAAEAETKLATAEAVAAAVAADALIAQEAAAATIKAMKAQLAAVQASAEEAQHVASAALVDKAVAIAEAEARLAVQQETAQQVACQAAEATLQTAAAEATAQLIAQQQSTSMTDLELWAPPHPITMQMANLVQSLVQDLVPGGDIQSFWPTTVISYATGSRPGDAKGAGPGMYFATAMVRALAAAGFSCFSGLAIPGGVNWRIFMLRLDLEDCPKAVAKVLLTQAFFQSTPCLKEVYAAIKNGVTIIPVRLEEELPPKREQWLELSASANADDMLTVAEVKKEMAKLNCIPVSP